MSRGDPPGAPPGQADPGHLLGPADFAAAVWRLAERPGGGFERVSFLSVEVLNGSEVLEEAGPARYDALFHGMAELASEGLPEGIYVLGRTAQHELTLAIRTPDEAAARGLMDGLWERLKAFRTRVTVSGDLDETVPRFELTRRRLAAEEAAGAASDRGPRAGKGRDTPPETLH